MTRADLLKLHVDLCDAAHSLMERKNHDYAGQGRAVVDPFANFRLCEAAGLCSMEVGVLVRLGDKLARLATFATVGKLMVEDEKVEDTVLDAINYCVLFMGIVKERKANERG